MESYNRPITPPTDRTKEKISAVPTSNGGISTIPNSFMDRNENLNDITHLQKQQSNIPVNTAPSAPSTAAFSSNNNNNGNPFVAKDEKKLTSEAPFDDLNVKPVSRQTESHSSFNDTFKQDATTTTRKSTNYTRNDTTHRIESEVLRILQWKNPVRSGSIFAIIVGSIILTRWYSLLQISATCLTLAIGINLVYVNLILQSQKVLTNQDPSHPYNDVIHNEKNTMIDKQSVRHYSTVITEVSETVIRALTRIIFIENTVTSVKWMSIFFVIWKVAAHVSTMDIVLMVVISAFTFPRLYISNKEVVDAHIQKGQTMIQTGINKAQNAATENVQNTYVKARAFVAKAGTTGTDAKNTMSKHSVTMKDDSM